MSDDQPKPNGHPQPTSDRPAPPPYNPDRSLIGYIEKGQNAPADVRKRG